VIGATILVIRPTQHPGTLHRSEVIFFHL